MNLTWAATDGTITQAGEFTAPVSKNGTSLVVSVLAEQPSTGASSTAAIVVNVIAEPPPRTPTAVPVNPLASLPEPPVPSQSNGTTALIKPNEGGSATTPDGKASVTVKPGSVTEFIAMDVAPVAEALVPPISGATRFKVSGTVVDLTFTTPDGEAIDDFAPTRPVIVSLKFTGEDAEAAGSAFNLAILKYDEDAGAWTPLLTTVDLLTKTLTAEVRSFSLFGVGVPVQEAVEPTATFTVIPPVTPTPTVTPAPTAIPTPAPTTVPPTAAPRPDVALPATGGYTLDRGLVGLLVLLGGLAIGAGIGLALREGRS